jgi:hypothetical protein
MPWPRRYLASRSRGRTTLVLGLGEGRLDLPTFAAVPLELSASRKDRFHLPQQRSHPGHPTPSGVTRIVWCRSVPALTARSGGSSVESLRSLFLRITNSTAITVLHSSRSTGRAKETIPYICVNVMPQQNATLQRHYSEIVIPFARPTAVPSRICRSAILKRRATIEPKA